jgi:predicted transcriptional regulator of viral defense system
MNTINLLETIKNDYKGVFRTYDIGIIENNNINYSSLVANRLVKHGYAKRIGRNKFYLPGTDIFAIASNILEPSYIGILSAFSYYNLVTQIYNTVYVISTKRHKDIEIEGYKIKFIILKNTKLYGFH